MSEKIYCKVTIPEEMHFQSRRIDAGGGGFRVSKEEPGKAWLDPPKVQELRKMGYGVEEIENAEQGVLRRQIERARGSAQRRASREGRRGPAEAMRQEEWPISLQKRKALDEKLGIKTKEDLAGSTTEDLKSVEGIGDKTAAELLEWAGKDS